MKTKGYVLAVISAIAYGLIPLFMLPMKEINFPRDVTLFYRFLFASALLAGFLLYQRESFKVTGKELLILIFLGVFFALSSETLFLGYDYLSAGIASTILFVYPVIVALIMAFRFKEKIKGKTVVALVFSLLGIFILSVKDRSFSINVPGLLVTILSAFFYACYIVVVNKAKINASGIKITFYSLLFSCLFYWGKVMLLKEPLSLPNVETGLHILLFALVTTVLAIGALVYAVKLIGSTSASIMGAMEPVVAVAISVLLFQERLTVNLVIGVLLILTGVLLNMLGKKKKPVVELNV